jgi:hypothetical protein
LYSKRPQANTFILLPDPKIQNLPKHGATLSAFALLPFEGMMQPWIHA